MIYRMGKGKYSKEYNIQHKHLRYFLDEFRAANENYTIILEQVTQGSFEDANKKCLGLLDEVKTLNQSFLDLDYKIQKLFLRKWLDKYKRYDINDPFGMMLDDLDDILTSIERIFEMRGEKK